MHLREMDERLRKLWRAQHTGDQEAQEQYTMELQRQLKHAYVLVVNTNTWYGRGTPPLLSQQFDKVQTAWDLIINYGRLPFRMGIDEDAFFTANAHPDLPLMVINAFNNNERTISLGGLEFYIDPDDMDDSEFYLTNHDGGHDIRLVIKEELDDPKPQDYGVKRLARLMTDTSAVTNDPITTWWESYGKFSNNSIDMPAREVIDRLNLDLSDHVGGVIEDLDEEDLEESLTNKLDSVLYESNTSSDMTNYIKLLMRYLNIVYPEIEGTNKGYRLNKKSKDHNKITSNETGKTVSISKSPKNMDITDSSIPKNFRNEFGIVIPSHPKQKKVFTNPEKAHKLAGVHYDGGPKKKRRVGRKMVKRQELQELQEMPQTISACEARMEEINQELISLYSTRSDANRKTAILLATELIQKKKEHEQLETRYIELMEKH